MLDVEATLAQLGIEGRGYGGEFSAPCPMHLARTGKEDGHPSWSINLNTGLFICYSCGYRGSLLTLISDMTGVSLDEAKAHGVKVDLQTTVARMRPVNIAPRRDKVFPESSLAQFHEPPRWARNKRGVSMEACQWYGVKWDHLDESWILPIRRSDGTLIGWQVKGESSRVFKNYPLGVKKSQCLFGYERFEGGRMVVVESPLDTLRMRTNGITGGVSTFGSEVSRAQIGMMTAADEVVFALDNYKTDDAGRKSTLRLIKQTRGVLASVRVFNYGGIDAKDPGDMTPEEVEQGIAFARSRALGERAIS